MRTFAPVLKEAMEIHDGVQRINTTATMEQVRKQMAKVVNS